MIVTSVPFDLNLLRHIYVITIDAYDVTSRETGMSDLIVDYQVLEQSEQLLGRLQQQIGGSSTSLATDADWGFGGVTSAMGGFYGDWSYHRKQIMDRMQTLHTMSTQSRQAFQGADAKLASELKKADDSTATANARKG
jgi:hypothetical protein